MTTIHALCGGMIELDRSSFFSDVAPGTRITIPVMCFLISHPRGHVLVDTGVHRQARTDPVGRMGERRASLFGMRSAPTDEVVSQLALLGLAPSDVRYVVNSHLHFDHCGGNEFFLLDLPGPARGDGRGPPRARRQSHAVHAERHRLRPPSTTSSSTRARPLRRRPGRPPADLRPHARAPVGARARGQGTELVLTADACYTRENMDRDILPTVLWDPTEMSRSLGALRNWRDKKGATVIYGHDAAQWQTLHRAPAPLI
jgi:glyoxylase-like metal-dependent hydrolase (beta-lactamase superfamily II)